MRLPHEGQCQGILNTVDKIARSNKATELLVDVQAGWCPSRRSRTATDVCAASTRRLSPRSSVKPVDVARGTAIAARPSHEGVSAESGRACPPGPPSCG